ncbi:hypothetical protein LZD49_35020 [Dyadobacter sp. CY261]|uniref:hypothetical protein n=1 Tax=Dyadobacter sp. CY261 TaxID=2907203 RepID=UPI001F28976D|nr:hypothetical protein [Dyadobacter sp. CY261]MCF0075736.1 hypothetical protein [Dyadobacter sp. CY261]
MKTPLFSIILLFVLVACEKDSPKPDPEIKTIVGKWKHTAYEKNVNGSNIWVPIDGEPNYIVFRYDGVILDSNGCPNCAPKSYYVNGKLFEVIPKEAISISSQCPIVDCIGCATWDIDQSDNELIVTLCEPSNTKSKYIRE